MTTLEVSVSRGPVAPAEDVCHLEAASDMALCGAAIDEPHCCDEGYEACGRPVCDVCWSIWRSS